MASLSKVSRCTTVPGGHSCATNPILDTIHLVVWFLRQVRHLDKEEVEKEERRGGGEQGRRRGEQEEEEEGGKKRGGEWGEDWGFIL